MSSPKYKSVAFISEYRKLPEGIGEKAKFFSENIELLNAIEEIISTEDMSTVTNLVLNKNEQPEIINALAHRLFITAPYNTAINFAIKAGTEEAAMLFAEKLLPHTTLEETIYIYKNTEYGSIETLFYEKLEKTMPEEKYDEYRERYPAMIATIEINKKIQEITRINKKSI